jgi:hypothetical protein
MFAGRLRALAEVCERQAEKAARADAAEALARKGLNSSSPIFRSHLRLQATRAAQLAEGTLEKIEDLTAPPQERAQRRRKLTKGPSEFREDRIDQPGEILSQLDLRLLTMTTCAGACVGQVDEVKAG